MNQSAAPEVVPVVGFAPHRWDRPAEPQGVEPGAFLLLVVLAWWGLAWSRAAFRLVLRTLAKA